MMTARDLLKKYQENINTHHFEDVAPLIAEDATFWFSNGSHKGTSAIKAAFEKTWSLIQEETYWLTDIVWLVDDPDSAACIYTFHWKGKISGQLREGSGRGTTVLKKTSDAWKIVHEHLSNFPA